MAVVVVVVAVTETVLVGVGAVVVVRGTPRQAHAESYTPGLKHGSSR